MKKLTVSIAALLALSPLFACSSFQFDEQGIGLTRDLEEDVLEVELVYRNVRPRSDEEYDRDEYSAALRRILERGRLIVLPALYIDLDVDRWLEDLEASEEPLDERGRRVQEYLRGISVVEARTFEDEEGRLVLVQKLVLPRFSEGLRLWIEMQHRQVLDEEGAGGFGADSRILDARTRRLWIEEAREGVDWVSWNGAELTVAVPTTPHSAARLIEQLWIPPAYYMGIENTYQTMVGLVRSLSSIEIRDDHVYLAFSPGEDGLLRFELDGIYWEE